MTGFDVNTRVDPEVRALLERVKLFPHVDVTTLAAARSAGSELMATIVRSELVERSVIEVPGPVDSPLVPLRVLRPKGTDGPLPCIYWMHGGGYVMGAAADDDVRFDKWCTALGMIGVSVEYRLAPETAFPGPRDDCVAGLRWLFDHAAELGIDRTRIGVGGASAGGGLAASVAFAARDLALPVIFQLLLYPMLDDRMQTDSSTWDSLIWTPASNRYAWNSYLGPLSNSVDVPAEAAPARMDDLSNLPPTLMIAAGLDVFVDENLEYVARMNRGGVSVESHLYPGAPHAFESFAPRAAVSRRCHRDIVEWLSRRIPER